MDRKDFFKTMILGSAAISLLPQVALGRMERAEMFISDLPSLKEHIRHGQLGQDAGWSPPNETPLKHVQRHRFFANGRGPSADDLVVWQWEWNGTPQVVSMKKGEMKIQTASGTYSPRIAESVLPEAGGWSFVRFSESQVWDWNHLERPLMLVPVSGTGTLEGHTELLPGKVAQVWKERLEIKAGKDGLVMWVGVV